MNEKTSSDKIRPTKKQQSLLEYIDRFIREHGYSPSYREIMAGCNYTSVATVALHVNSLISRGQLVKRGRSARSLELAEPNETKFVTNQVSASEEKWLVEKVEYYFNQAEASPANEPQLYNLEVLLAALKVLGLDGAAQSFASRLAKLKSY